MRKKSRKAQISFEFIMIFSLIFIMLTGFIYIINQRLTELGGQREQATMKNLVDNIINEIVLSSSVNNNYIRRFDLPVKLDGRDYRLSLDSSEITVEVLENGNVVSDYFAVSPVDVKGGFIEDIEVNTVSHCITKSNLDGVRISRNQASIDTNITELGQGEMFDVFVSINCVEDVKSASFTVRYDPAKLILQAAEPIIAADPEYKSLNPLFESYTVIYNYEGTDAINEAIGRFTYGYIGTECVTGSGNLAKLSFEVKDNAELGETYIEFDPTYEENIRLLDCNTDKFTEEDLPDSRNNAEIEITN